MRFNSNLILLQKVAKYAKSVFQMERGLPPNGVVPLLKEKVDDMKSKVPVITNLRNQSLKARHWEVCYILCTSLTSFNRAYIFSNIVYI